MKERKGERELRPEERLDRIAKPMPKSALKYMENFLQEVNLPEADTSVDIAFKILDQLDRLGMDKGDLAKKLGVTQACVTRYVSGRCNFTLRTLVQLERALDINLIDRESEPKQKEPVNFVLNLTNMHPRVSQYLDLIKRVGSTTVAEPEPLYARSTQKQYAKMA